MSGETERREALWRNFADKEYRGAFVECYTADSLAVQIFSMRVKREWTRADLARRAGVHVSVVRELEKSRRLPPLAVLAKIASAFDVALAAHFIPFSEFLAKDRKPIDRHIRSFEEDSLHER